MHKPLLLVLLLASAPCAAADGLSYQYLELDAARQSLPGGTSVNPMSFTTVTTQDSDLDGFAIHGAAPIGETLYAFGGYRQGHGDARVDVRQETPNGTFFGSSVRDVEGRQLNLGLGLHRPLQPRIDALAELGLISTRVDVDGDRLRKGEDVRLALGLRGALSPSIEGWAKAHYTDGDLYDGAAGATLGAQFKFNPMWGVVAEADLGDEISAWQVGVRASF